MLLEKARKKHGKRIEDNGWLQFNQCCTQTEWPNPLLEHWKETIPFFISSFIPFFYNLIERSRTDVRDYFWMCGAPTITTGTTNNNNFNVSKMALTKVHSHLYTDKCSGQTQKKNCRERVPHIHTKGRKRDTHGGNNSALSSYCKFSVGRFFFTFVILPVPVVKKQILIWVLHINGTGNLVGGLPKLFTMKLKLLKK